MSIFKKILSSFVCIILLFSIILSNNIIHINAAQSLPKIIFVSAKHTPLLEGEKESFIIISNVTQAVQYKAVLISNNTKKVEELTKGYTSPTVSNLPYEIKYSKCFKKGIYKIKFYVKGSTSNGKYIDNKIRYDNMYTLNLSCLSKADNPIITNNDLDINIKKPKIGERLIIKGIKKLTKNCTYSLNIYDAAKNSWIIQSEFSKQLEWFPEDKGIYLLKLSVKCNIKNKTYFGTNLEIFKVDDNKDLSNTDIEEILQAIKSKNEAIAEKDIKRYMNLINKENKEYYAEQLHWFQDIQANDIENYNCVINSINKTSDNTLILSLTQTYHYMNKDYSISFNEVYSKINNIWLDSDLHLNSVESNHFIVKYFDGYESAAKDVLHYAEFAYSFIAKSFGEAPADKTAIKLYNNSEILRQSAKLSFTWNFTGWYEYPESIKAYIKSNNVPPTYWSVIAHELTHKTSIAKSNNNMPYWFCEGIAQYFSASDPKVYIDKNNILSIIELEKINLETLTDDNDISTYYSTSNAIVTFMCKTYGVDKVKEIIAQLGKYPLSEGSVGEFDKEHQAKFREVITKVLRLNIEQLDDAWKVWAVKN